VEKEIVVLWQFVEKAELLTRFVRDILGER
jgi:hypothetical protein